MQKEILDKQPETNFRVYAVWMPLTHQDARTEWEPELLSDARVTHYWDEACASGSWFSEHVSGQRPVSWDAYFLYDANATWEEVPDLLISEGHPIISAAEQLRADLLALGPAPADQRCLASNGSSC